LCALAILLSEPPAHLATFSVAVTMSKPIDWNLCIICQEISSAELRCPTKCASDRPPVDIYNVFLENVEKFKELDALPVNVDYGEQGTALAFVENNASWHKQCHQKFNNSKLERVKQRLHKKKEIIRTRKLYLRMSIQA